MTRVAIYAGTFDPMTNGHLDIIIRSAEIFDRVILAVAKSTPKSVTFTVEERLEIARTSIAGLSNVEVDSFNGLLIDYARAKNLRVLVRGLRAYSDFEYEFQMALTNRKLAPEIETIFMMPKEIHSYVSSSIVREVAALGGNIRDFVPPSAVDMILRKFKK